VAHRIIIIGHRAAAATHDSSATGSIDWTPSHTLTPQQVARRIERAERKLDEAEAMLTAPVGDEAHVE
jgi:hypothetical protein